MIRDAVQKFIRERFPAYYANTRDELIDNSAESLRDSIAGLPDRQRNLLERYYGIAGHQPQPLVTIGRSLGISESAAEEMYRRAILALQEAIAGPNRYKKTADLQIALQYALAREPREGETRINRAGHQEVLRGGRWHLSHELTSPAPQTTKPVAGSGLQPASHSGTGKQYQLTMANGTPLPDHLSKLRLPPAWKDVHIDPTPGARLIATGYDDKGRRQSVYSSEHDMRQTAAKFSRIRELHDKFDEVLAENDRHGGDLADITHLLAVTGLRPGSNRDTKAEKQAYGATTLLGKHVVADGDGVRLEFTGKKGVSLSIPIRDERAAKMLLRRKQAAGPDGQLFAVTDSNLRKYVATLDGGGFTPKDFRTHLGTETAADLVRRDADCCQSPKAYKRRVLEVAKAVADRLGNTPKIALQSYIDPTVFLTWKENCDACN